MWDRRKVGKEATNSNAEIFYVVLVLTPINPVDRGLFLFETTLNNKIY